MIVPLQRIDIDGQIEDDGQNAYKIDEHGNGAEEILESQGTEKIKTEHIEKNQGSDGENIFFIPEIQAESRDDQ
jgi:hypothetical protein